MFPTRYLEKIVQLFQNIDSERMERIWHFSLSSAAIEITWENEIYLSLPRFVSLLLFLRVSISNTLALSGARIDTFLKAT